MSQCFHMLSWLGSHGISRAARRGFGACFCVRSMSTVKLSFSVEGEEETSHSPLVILHGVLGSKMNWRTISKALSTRLDRPVYALDARNHGQSPWSENMSYIDMSDDVSAFLKDRRLPSCCLVGHSMGGKTAMVTALRHQEVIDRLIVVDSAPVFSPGTVAITSYVNVLTSVELNSPNATTRRQVESLIKENIPEKVVRGFLLTNLMSGDDGLFWRANLKDIERNLPHISSFPNLHNTYSGPTLFIGGRRSNYLGNQERESLLRFFPRAQVEMLDTGHWVHFEDPNGLISSVASFLADQ